MLNIERQCKTLTRINNIKLLNTIVEAIITSFSILERAMISRLTHGHHCA